MPKHGKCVILVDYSNIFIGGQKYSAHKKGVTASRRHDDQPSDPSWRINFEALRSCLAEGREVHAAILVASGPDEDHAIWEAARGDGFQVVVHEREAHQGEKAVDTELVARGAEIIASGGEPMALVLASGDQDYVPLVELAHRHGWRVEICAFTADLARKGELAETADRVRPLNECFSEIGYYEYEWPGND